MLYVINALQLHYNRKVSTKTPSVICCNITIYEFYCSLLSPILVTYIVYSFIFLLAFDLIYDFSKTLLQTPQLTEVA